MKRISIGLIGCGRIGERHAEHIAATTGLHLAAVCDIDLIKVRSLADTHDAKAYTDVQTLLDAHPEIDLLAICTPNGLHAPISIAALRAGKHVLCEKPMALTAVDALDMIATSLSAQRHLIVVKQNRFNPPVIALRKALLEGRLGRVLNVHLNCFWNRNPAYYTDGWRGTLDMDGGTLFTQFSHFIDLMLLLVGDVEHVEAMGGNLNHQGSIRFEDSGAVALRFASGAIGAISYTVNSHQRNMEGSITLFGEHGTVKVGGQYLNTLDYQCISGEPIVLTELGNAANNYGTYQGSMSNHGLVYENVLDVMTKDATITANMYDGLRTVELIERIYAAMERTGGRSQGLQ